MTNNNVDGIENLGRRGHERGCRLSDPHVWVQEVWRCLFEQLVHGDLLEQLEPVQLCHGVDATGDHKFFGIRQALLKQRQQDRGALPTLKQKVKATEIA